MERLPGCGRTKGFAVDRPEVGSSLKSGLCKEEKEKQREKGGKEIGSEKYTVMGQVSRQSEKTATGVRLKQNRLAFDQKRKNGRLSKKIAL